MTDPLQNSRLDALLRDLPPVPALPAGLRDRVLAAAAATPQEPRPARARRAARRERRGSWLRRPLLAGTAALGLLVTSAVAATLAGVPIPEKIASVFSSAKAPESKAPPATPAIRRPASASVAPARTAMAESATEPPAWFLQKGPWRRLLAAQRVIEARRAMGLPTPRADRIERRLDRRARLWREATPERRMQWLERRQARQEARRAAVATPEGQAVLAARQERRRQWRAMAPIERRAQLRQWRQEDLADAPLTTEERAWRQERLRRWREQRRARRLARMGQAEASPSSEGAPDQPAR